MNRALPAMAVLAALGATAPALAQSPSCQPMGGTAIFEAVPGTGGFMVAMSGDFEGGVFARVIGEPRQLGNGRTGYDLEHFFARADGSTISTKDESVWVTVPGDDRVLAATTYRVQRATGSLQGSTGEFRSWGSINAKTGQGVLRFSGEICRR
ncbi:MAG: hypothetical protein ACK4K7_10050 [Allosphingosinicella sp.]|uniref:hypothetical protein n=1 Tax=Allosphingosinicella sp. TaxID=2823234 RepID=UPI00393E41EC